MKLAVNALFAAQLQSIAELLGFLPATASGRSRPRSSWGRFRLSLRPWREPRG